LDFPSLPFSAQPQPPPHPTETLKHRLVKAVFRFLKTGEAGIEPATYGFGDRCSAN
jgi:hypothetical protein